MLQHRPDLGLRVSLCVLIREPLGRKSARRLLPSRTQVVALKDLRESIILPLGTEGRTLLSHPSLPSFREQQDCRLPTTNLPTSGCPSWPGWEPVPPAGLMLSCSASRSSLRPCPTYVLSHLSVLGPSPAPAAKLSYACLHPKCPEASYVPASPR